MIGLTYLSKDTDAAALRAMSDYELNALAAEIRSFLIGHVSQTGGHLASNLGVVELTLAIHRVFDTRTDRLLFDVGHQSYVHKLLTGRLERFDTLRTFGGLAGFPKPSESVHDAFTAGHASSAVSTALGMARARTRMGEDYSVIAVVGDGAMTGGLFYEGMNDAGSSGEPLIVILNDNGMSISKNVGSISYYLSRLRLKSGYFGLKKRYRFFVKRLPGGAAIYRATHRLKERLRRHLIGTTVFEQMGFQYLGPVDGHDIRTVSELLVRAREEKRPVLLHVITKKGRGYTPAEVTPSEYHGVGSFDPLQGVGTPSEDSFSGVFGAELCRLAERDERICAVTAGMRDGVGLSEFARRFPKRFFDVGIAEGHAVSMAAGLAKQGLRPVVAIYSTFLQRAYDMLLQDAALQALPIVFCVDRAGLVGADGETHHGAFDVGYLRSVPGMTVESPASYAELRSLLRAALSRTDGPTAIRYPRGKEPKLPVQTEPGLVRDGTDAVIVTYGTTVSDALAAAELLEKRGVSAAVLRLCRLKPLAPGEAAELARRTGRLILAEEQNADAGIGEAVGAYLMEQGCFCRFRRLDLGDRFVTHGDTDVLRRVCGIDADAIASAVLEEIQREP